MGGEAACGAGMQMQGSRGTWGAGRGQQDIKSRDGRRRPAGVDTCLGRQDIQDRKRRMGSVATSCQRSSDLR